MKAELDLIQQQLDQENENNERRRRLLEPEEHAKLAEETKTVSPQPAKGLKISEQILLKYKRSNELQTFFE